MMTLGPFRLWITTMAALDAKGGMALGWGA